MLIHRFSNLEFNRWDALRSAIDQLIANGTYERFVRIHSDSWGRHRMHESMSGEVGRQRFLPWHRAYLINFERELRTIDESLSISVLGLECGSGEVNRIFRPARDATNMAQKTGHQTQ